MMKLLTGVGFKGVLIGLLLVFMAASWQFLTDPLAGMTNVVTPAVKVTRGIEYGTVGGATLRLDVYEPRAWSVFPRPSILLIHGGGWTGGDKDGERDLAASLVPQGFVAFAINYRLAHEGRNRYPAQIQDARRAVRWIRLHAHDFGADPDRLAAVGWSAGGHLAGLLGTTDVEDPEDPNSREVSSRVDCVVSTAGPTDFTDAANPAVGPSLAETLPMLFGRSLGDAPGLYRDASPVAFADSKAAPTLLFHGAQDAIVPVEQARRFHRALQAAGAEVRYVEIADEGHGFLAPDNHRRWTDEIAGFLVHHLKP